MEYRAVGDRCAVDLDLLHLPVSNKVALAILIKKGFKILEVNLVDLARQCIKTSKYRRGVKPSEAPARVDCSSFIKWLFGQRGIWLPRRSIQQRELGESVSFEEIARDDVVFASGWIDYYHDNSLDGVGHVGIATGEETVIHAANNKANVVESSLKSFASKAGFRGIRRYVSRDKTVLTLETPTAREVEIADDMRWIILQSLPKQ